MQRFLGVCLKILYSWVIVTVLMGHSVNGASWGISELTTDTIYKKFLKLRSLPFEDCGSQYDILYLNINSCTKLPCEMTLGTEVIVNVVFDDNGANTSFLKHSVRWIFNAVRTDARITPDPCDGDHKCLTNDIEGKSYWAYLHVDKTLPSIGGSMLWEATNENDTKVMCFKVPVVITEAPKKEETPA